jgi:hypothetical protein
MRGRRDQLCERGQGWDPFVAGVEVEAERIHEEWPDPGPPGADDVDGGHVADVPDLVHVEAEEVDGSLEDPRIGLHDADGAGVDDALDVHADAGAHLTELKLGEPPGHHAVGIRDDTEPDPGVG